MQVQRESVFIVVPAYNEGAAVFDVVRDLRAAYPNVVVVDDGSSDATADEARRAGARVLRHVINRGQGAALQTGLTYSLRAGAEAIVTFDADGQHEVAAIARLVDALENADVAVGSRFLAGAAHVPPVRRLLLRVATVFMRYSSGVPLTDAHNGLRAFRRSAAEQIRITLDGMAHASEIVDQFHALRLRVTEVPVVIRYSEYSLRKGQSSLAAFRIAFDYLLKRWFR
jgi:glycosyltransferase involved in cell wall biosynthesis